VASLGSPGNASSSSSAYDYCSTQDFIEKKRPVVVSKVDEEL